MWLVSEVVDHVGIYGSKAAKGFTMLNITLVLNVNTNCVYHICYLFITLQIVEYTTPKYDQTANNFWPKFVPEH